MGAPFLYVFFVGSMIPLCELKPVGAGVRKDGSRFFVGCVCQIVRLLITTNNVVLADSICIPIKIVSDLDNITVYIYFIEHSIFFYNSCFSTKKRVCIIIFEGYYYFTIFVYIAPKFTLSNRSKTMSKKTSFIVLGFYYYFTVVVNETVFSVQFEICKFFEEIAQFIVDRSNDDIPSSINTSPFPIFLYLCEAVFVFTSILETI